MEHDRWSWFAGGIVRGLLIGAGIVGSYSMRKVADADKARLKAETALEEIGTRHFVIQSLAGDRKR